MRFHDGREASPAALAAAQASRGPLERSAQKWTQAAPAGFLRAFLAEWTLDRQDASRRRGAWTWRRSAQLIRLAQRHAMRVRGELTDRHRPLLRVTGPGLETSSFACASFTTTPRTQTTTAMGPRGSAIGLPQRGLHASRGRRRGLSPVGKGSGVGDQIEKTSAQRPLC